MPLHVWLPLAHPAAPSHVSALMSGVMTKVAIYGFIRIIFDLVGAPEWWQGMAVLVLGGITAVIGVLYALMEHDLKRLLAYHTIENIGIIFIGLGLRAGVPVERHAGSGGAVAHRGAVSRFQPFSVQEPAFLRQRGRAELNRRTRHGTAWRAHSSHAANGGRFPRGLRGHICPATAEWICL